MTEIQSLLTQNPFPGAGGAVVKVIIAVLVFYRVVVRSMRMELDIWGGVAPEEVRRHYRKLFHGKRERRAYERAVRQFFGIEEDASLTGARLFARQIETLKTKKRKSISARANIECHPDKEA